MVSTAWALCLTLATDLQRFPCREAAWANYRFAAAHRAWLESRCCLPDAYAWRAEHRQCLAAWEALADTWGGEPGCEDYRALERLYSVLGEAAYRQGVMPPPCPWWRFVLVD